jgi:hypothetical protein
MSELVAGERRVASFTAPLAHEIERIAEVAVVAVVAAEEFGVVLHTDPAKTEAGPVRKLP